MDSNQEVMNLIFRDSAPWRQDNLLTGNVIHQAESMRRRSSVKWREGTERYGSSFQGDVIEHAREEVADLGNYLTVIGASQAHMFECLRQAYDKLRSIAEMYDGDPGEYMREAIPLLFEGEQDAEQTIYASDSDAYNESFEQQNDSV